MVYRIDRKFGRKYRMYVFIYQNVAREYRDDITETLHWNIAWEHRKDGTETSVFSMISGNQDILPNRPDRPRKNDWMEVIRQYFARIGRIIQEGLDGYSVFIHTPLSHCYFSQQGSDGKIKSFYLLATHSKVRTECIPLYFCGTFCIIFSHRFSYIKPKENRLNLAYYS